MRIEGADATEVPRAELVEWLAPDADDLGAERGDVVAPQPGFKGRVPETLFDPPRAPRAPATKTKPSLPPKRRRRR